MNKEEIIAQKEKCKKNVITLAVLCGIFLSFILFGSIAYAILIVAFGDDGSEGGIAISTIVYVVLAIIFAIGLNICTPFLIINSIKLGKRNRLLKKMEDNPYIDVE